MRWPQGSALEEIHSSGVLFQFDQESYLTSCVSPNNKMGDPAFFKGDTPFKIGFSCPGRPGELRSYPQRSGGKENSLIFKG